jgi:hypothetical protein
MLLAPPLRRRSCRIISAFRPENKSWYKLVEAVEVVGVKRGEEHGVRAVRNRAKSVCPPQHQTSESFMRFSFNLMAKYLTTR